MKRLTLVPKLAPKTPAVTMLRRARHGHRSITYFCVCDFKTTITLDWQAHERSCHQLARVREEGSTPIKAGE
jgi:hypothetical protein